ncbi:hypothetical protein CC80DRAFT_511277 [Byssothecium circinans]|uniref:F-box domain-containing protein n=1 Tax=Byssothecium circinans TaxID=147558 RepID=A0A6A5T8H0_9PLEO|nr:hypothetical protein CC80DRAFT_511277 [Byssothecium circinans]
MSIISLPPELRLLIAEHLDPRSCFRFALTCREHSRLLSALVATHKELWTRYNTIDTHDAGRLMWNLTKDIIENPKIANYIEDISLPNTRQQVWDAEIWHCDLYAGSPHLLSDDLVQQYASAIRKSPFLDDTLDEFYPASPLKPGWPFGSAWSLEKMIRVGSDWPLAVHLVCQAINLETLRFTEFSLVDEFEFLCWRAAKAHHDPVPPPDLPFQHLKRVAIAFDVVRGFFYDHWAHVFLSIPTVTEFAGYKMGSNTDPDVESLLGYKSKVKELLFQHSFINLKTIDSILARCEALESFTYENGGSCVSDFGAFAPRKVTELLLKHAVHSLEVLTLLDTDGFDYEDEEIDYVSLRGFQKLKILCCSWAVITGDQTDESDVDASLPDGEFFTHEDSGFPNLALRLPESLEVLYLDGSPELPEHWKSLVDLIRDGAASFPNLKRVYARNMGGAAIDDLTEASEERGVVLDQTPHYTLAVDRPLAKLLEGQGVC